MIAPIVRRASRLVVMVASVLALGCGGSGSHSDGGTSSQTALVCLNAGGGDCSCTPSLTGTSQSCTGTGVDQGYGSVCCSAPGSWCSCGAFLCASFSSFCQCAWVGQAGGTPTGSCTGKYCCASKSDPTGVCACDDNTPCDSDSVQVDSCTPTTTPACGGGKQQVASCN
jgi:hypothetical protein